MHKKLFIPGPVEVSPDTLQAMAKPMIGHRASEYSDLQGGVTPKLQRLLNTKGDVFLATCSATGVMEAAIRNLSTKRVLSCTCGAFSERWFEICAANGKAADPLRVEWGKAIKPQMVDEYLHHGEYDLVTCVHNETSTGVMNPIPEIAKVVQKYPGVLFAVDSVSAMAGVPIDVDGWGLDVCLAGTQKAFALPPGLTVFSVGARALERAKTVPNRGAYIDFVEFKTFDQKHQTPTTPAISMIYGLDFQLDRFFTEGLDARFARHRTMAEACRAWAKERGFALYPEAGYESVTLTAVSNTRNVDITAGKKEMAKRGYSIDDGYGKIKGKTFRIAHMGDCTLPELREVLGQLDEVLKLK